MKNALIECHEDAMGPVGMGLSNGREGRTGDLFLLGIVAILAL